MNKTLSNKTAMVIKIVAFVLIFGTMIGLFIAFFDFFYSLLELSNRQALRDDMLAMGWWGYGLAFLIQFTQVVISILPGEVVELFLGMAYGPFIGLLIALLGVLAGTTVAYYLAKWVGIPFVRLFIKKDYFAKYTFLNDEKKVAMGVLIVYLIVGLPVDTATYLAPTLKIKFWKFLLISTFARIPKIVSSTIVGHYLVEDNIWVSIIVFFGTALLSVLAALIFHFLDKKRINKEKAQANK
ncbi:MAG: TVP38/TMEM64 family protein [Bacteroidia bacterium]|nr:TVP38/TMEM64 family protein [Bacteroidia bacterium]